MYIPRLWKAKDVAKRANCGLTTVYDWVYKGLIPHVIVGKSVRFHKHEIEEWLENGRGKGEKR